MVCETVSLPGGEIVIACSRQRGRRRRCKCGRPATLLCDWKMPRRKSGTCDAPLCAGCSTAPAPGKDLCPAHAKAFRDWLVRAPGGGTAA